MLTVQPLSAPAALRVPGRALGPGWQRRARGSAARRAVASPLRGGCVHRPAVRAETAAGAAGRPGEGNASAVPGALCVSFPPPSSGMACPGFNKQRAKCEPQDSWHREQDEQCKHIYANSNIPGHPSPYPPWYPQACSLYLCLCFCFASIFICTIFLDFTYK